MPFTAFSDVCLILPQKWCKKRVIIVHEHILFSGLCEIVYGLVDAFSNCAFLWLGFLLVYL